MNRVECFITAHIGDNINECDDNFAVNIANNSFAVADGSSSDFFSNIYARLLADTFVAEDKKMFAEERIKEINLTWRNQVQQKLSDAGCKPGSFPYVRFQKMDPGCSTLIGLHLYESNAELKYRCSGLGDSVLFFIPKGEKVPSLQFSSYSNEQYTLDQSVEFGYVPVISRSYSTTWIEDIKEVERVLQEGVFYLMTDGLAEWILRRDNGEISEKFEILYNIHSQKDFLLYIDDIRSKGAHNDDMTLMKVYIEDLSLSFDSSSEHIYDYRSAADEIEKEELSKRQESAKREEELARQKASVVANKKNEMDALLAAARARTAAQNLKKESLEKEKREEKNKVIIDSARKKIAEEKGKKTGFEDDDALRNKDDKREEEQEAQIQARIDEAVANAEKKKDEEFAEQLKLRKEEEDKVALEAKIQEDKEAEAQIQARIDEAVANAEKKKDEEFAEQLKLRKEEEDRATKEKKKIKNRIKSNRTSLILIISFIVCAFYFVSQHTKQEVKNEEFLSKVNSLYETHRKDSILLISEKNKSKVLESKYKKALIEIDKLKEQLPKKQSKKKKKLTVDSKNSNTKNS